MNGLNGRGDAVPPADDLLGSVKPYHHHVALCTGGPPELWAARVEEMEGLFATLHAALVARGLDRVVKLTACDDVSLGDEGLDALLMPAMVRMPALTLERVDALAEALAAEFRGGFPFDVAPMAGGDHLFVCVHAARDERCGAWGPAVAEALEREIERQGAIAQVHRTSHVGGHKYAATCIVYPQGVWYGNLRPHDAPQFVRAQLIEEQLVPTFYRGRLGLPFSAQIVEGTVARYLVQRYGRLERLDISMREELSEGAAEGRARALVPADGEWHPVTLRVDLSLRQGRWEVGALVEVSGPR